MRNIQRKTGVPKYASTFTTSIITAGWESPFIQRLLKVIHNGPSDSYVVTVGGSHNYADIYRIKRRKNGSFKVWYESPGSQRDRANKAVKAFMNPWSKGFLPARQSGKSHALYMQRLDRAIRGSKPNPHITYGVSQKPVVTNTWRPTVEQAATVSNVNKLANLCHKASKDAGWWDDAVIGDFFGVETKLLITPEKAAVKIALIHSELSEALEGVRKDKMDDHLPQRKAVEVELADTLFRIFDLAGAMGLDIGGAFVEKTEYNESRPDHKKEAREAIGGKKF